jgi:hypothetical protein
MAVNAPKIVLHVAYMLASRMIDPMGYKIRHKSSRVVHIVRRLRRRWQPAAVLTFFVLGTAVGTLMTMQQSSAVANRTANRSQESIQMIRIGTESAQKQQPTTIPISNSAQTGTVAHTMAASAPVSRTTSCGTAAPMRGNLERSSVPQLRKLVQYDAVCGNAVASRVSFFAGTPTTVAQAQEEAAWVATVLKELSKQGLGAVVFMEPASQGKILSSAQYQAGAYDAALEAYFAALKAKGISDAQMGMWVPFPEANIPVWDSTDPEIYIDTVVKTVRVQKKYFPGSKASIMLDSKSYPSASSWEGGAYKSFLPYVSAMPKGLIDSFGMQGFAWPPQDGEPAQLDAKVFLPVNYAIEAAAALEVKDIWFNTGSYGRAARQNKSKPDTLSQAQRQAVMKGIVAQAAAVQGRGYKVSIHLFAEDKYTTEEAIDWSYWDKGDSDTASFKPVFRAFVADMRKNNIPLWIFDAAQ